MKMATPYHEEEKLSRGFWDLRILGEFLGSQKRQILNTTPWGHTISWGSHGTAKSEGSVPLRKLAKSQHFFKE